MVRRHITIRGRVQGVGFRAFVAQQAAMAGVAGWVRNTSGGDVECMLEGDDTVVAALIERLREGPAMARVSDVEVEVQAPTGESGFRVTG